MTDDVRFEYLEEGINTLAPPRLDATLERSVHVRELSGWEFHGVDIRPAGERGASAVLTFRRRRMPSHAP